jgi:hypothetical protein
MVMIPPVPLRFAIDFIAKTVSVQGVTFGKTCTFLGLSINPIVGLIICGALVLTTILTWIFRKQIIKLFKAVYKWVTGIDLDIK